MSMSMFKNTTCADMHMLHEMYSVDMTPRASGYRQSIGILSPYIRHKQSAKHEALDQMKNIDRRNLMLFGDIIVDGTDYKPHQRSEIEQQTKVILMHMDQMRQCLIC
eukprot:816819_1